MPQRVIGKKEKTDETSVIGNVIKELQLNVFHDKRNATACGLKSNNTKQTY
jgi:hypothetical protein